MSSLHCVAAVDCPRWARGLANQRMVGMGQDHLMVGRGWRLAADGTVRVGILWVESSSACVQFEQHFLDGLVQS